MPATATNMPSLPEKRHVKNERCEAEGWVGVRVPGTRAQQSGQQKGAVEAMAYIRSHSRKKVWRAEECKYVMNVHAQNASNTTLPARPTPEHRRVALLPLVKWSMRNGCVCPVEPKRRRSSGRGPHTRAASLASDVEKVDNMSSRRSVH